MIFLVLWFIFMLSYGVGMTSVLLPQKISMHTLKDVLLYPYFNALGTVDYIYNQTDRKYSLTQSFTIFLSTHLRIIYMDLWSTFLDTRLDASLLF